MAKAVYGLFSTPRSAQRAYEGLRDDAARLGIRPRNIVSVSSEPFDDFEFGARDSETSMPWLAPAGGLVGAVGGYWLTALTQRDFPLPTGGMPIVVLWTNGIIMYELVMLGAILATLGALFVAAGLPEFMTHLYDPEVSQDKILIGVTNPPEELYFEIENKLLEAGADKVKLFPAPRAQENPKYPPRKGGAS